jgi:hypothetical protein
VEVAACYHLRSSEATCASSLTIQTLVDFVANHLPSALSFLQVSDGVALLTRKLKGAHVQVPASGEHEIRTVVGLQWGTVSDISPDQLPSTRGRYLSPNLPLINVGTVGKTLFIPMEICRILDDQALRGPRDVNPHSLVNKIDRERVSGNLSGDIVHRQLIPTIFSRSDPLS